MAAFKHLLSQARRRFSSDPTTPGHLFRRTFSSEFDRNLKTPLPIQPVSYPTKPKPDPQQQTPPESTPEQQTSPLDDSETQSWTRDEMRYMKDSSNPIGSVSYPNRVAPLPEDRPEAPVERNDQLESERRRIDEDRWRAIRERGGFRHGKENQEPTLPFPKMIKVDNNDAQNTKKKTKVVYDLKEAIRLVKASAKVTFDETLEAHVRMAPDLKRTDLKLNGFVRFPHGFGKTYRVAVFAEGAAADEAREAGADIVGGPELVNEILTGQLKVDFDKCISTQSMMAHVKKLSKILKQLMPDPKKKTVTSDILGTVKEAKQQGVLFKKDKTAIVHAGVGKLSFTEDALRDNLGAFVNALLLAKPAGLKKSSKYAGYVDSFHICSTMGPSFPITIQSLSMAADRYSKLQQLKA